MKAVHISPFLGLVCVALGLLGCGSADDMIMPGAEAEEVALCAQSPTGMHCLERDSGPLYLDSSMVRWADYELCVAAGECDEGLRPDLLPDPLDAITGLSSEQAAQYCAAHGKSVPEGLDLDQGLRCSASMEQAEALLSPDHRALSIRAADAVCSEAAERESSRPASFPSSSWAAVDTLYRRQFGRLLRRQQIHLSYKSPDMVEKLLCDLSSTFSKLSTVHLIGRSHQGRPILAMRISDRPETGADRPSILLLAGQHGHELLATEYAFEAIHQIFSGLHRDNVKSWLRTLDIWVVPLLNPDGADVMLHHDYSSKYGRKNGRDVDGDGVLEYASEGVDLGRNYPFRWGENRNGSGSRAESSDYRGLTPASEPESRAVMRLAADHHFLASLFWRTHGTSLLAPYWSAGATEPRPNMAWQIGLVMQESSPIQPSYRKFKLKRPSRAMDGTAEDWLFHTYGTLALTLLGSHHNPLEATVRAKSIAGAQPLLEALLDRVVGGPSIYGQVLDAQGNPVAAQIEVEGFVFSEDETWRARSSDGFYERVVPVAGSYVLRVIHPDGTETRHEVTIGDARQRLDIQL